MEDQINTKPQDKNQLGQNINNQSYSTPQKSKANFSILLVVIICFLIFGLGGYYLGTHTNKQTDKLPKKEIITSYVSKTPTISEVTLQPAISPINNQVLDTKKPTPSLKSYTTKVGEYTISYPEGWVLVDQSKWVDIYDNGKPQFQHDVSISKDSHVIRSYDPIAFSPGECYFRDDEPRSYPGIEDYKVSDDMWDYVEIKNSDIYFRRQKSGEITTVNKKNILKWGICVGKTGGFMPLPGFGNLWYETPVNYNPEIIKEMDQIIVTFPNRYGSYNNPAVDF